MRSREEDFPAYEMLSPEDYVVLLVGRVTYAWGQLETALHGHLTHLVAAESRLDGNTDRTVPQTWKERIRDLHVLTKINGIDHEIYKTGERLFGRLTHAANKRHQLSHSSWIISFEKNGLTLATNSGREADAYVAEMRKIHDAMRVSQNNARWRRRLREGHMARFTMSDIAKLEAEISALTRDLFPLWVQIDEVLTARRHALRVQQGIGPAA